jgi:TonB family protein
MKTNLNNTKKISAILFASAIFFCNVNAQSSNSVQTGTMISFLKEQKSNPADESLKSITTKIEEQVKFRAPSVTENEEVAPILSKYENTNIPEPVKTNITKVKASNSRTGSNSSSISDVNTFRKWLNSNLKNELSSVNKSITGKMIVSFIVDEKGEVANVKVESPSNNEVDEIIVDLIKSSPKWILPFENTQSMKQKFNLPVSYKVYK